MRRADDTKRSADSGAWAETQRDLGMLDRDVGLARPQPDDAAEEPAACETRVQLQGPIDQRRRGADVLAEIGEHMGGIREDARIVAGHLQGPPGKIDALAAVRLGILARAIETEPLAADRGPGECRPIARI